MQDKSEQLKEALNRKLTTEEIEKRLKEEMQLAAKKKEEEEENSTEEEPTPPSEEKVQIPDIRNKAHDDEKESNLMLYLVSTVAVLLLILTIYLFMKDATDKKVEIQPAEIAKETQTNQDTMKNIVQEEITKVLVEETKDSQNKKTEIVTEAAPATPKEIKTEEPKVVIKEKIIEKKIPLGKDSFKQFYNSLKFNVLKCYNFKAADIFPDPKCKTDMKKFLLANKNAIRFEVIPVLAEDDNQIFEKMKNSLQNGDEKFVTKVKEYMFRGLSRERVLEVTWQIKDILGQDVVLTPTNYYVKSKENNKGVIIRAYR